MNIRRLAQGVGANIFDKLAVAGTQLALVPIFAIHWGVAVYGGWVMLSTIPSFLAVSDLGFAGAAANEMTMLVARGERDRALRIFQSAWVVVLLSSTVMMTIAAFAAWRMPDDWLPVAPGLTAAEARLTLAVLMLYGIVALQGSIVIAGFRCAGLYSVSMMTTAVLILAENGTAGAAVLAGARPLTAALTLLGVRFVGLCAQGWLMRRQVRWLSFGFRHVSPGEMRALLNPALAMMMIPLSQAAVLQGTALMLGIAATQAAVPAFSATRTLSRIGLQFTQLLNNALMPEYSAAVGREDRPAQAMMVLLTLLAAAAVLVPFALVLVFLGQPLVRLWTAGSIAPSEWLLVAMATTVVLGGFWNPLSNLLLAMNRHAGFTYPYIAGAAVVMPLTYVLALRFGATGAGVSMALLDLLMCVVVVRLCRRLLPSWREVAVAFGRLGVQSQALRARLANRTKATSHLIP